MSQPRIRKASTAGEVPRVRSTVVKGSADSSTIPNRQKQNRSRSKNKIPKQIRYDLDNALVGLCDVWFEDIKPHLLRNNIKVHIHGDGASPASGDHQRPPAPPAPGCSHCDPGAASDPRRPRYVSYAACCSTPPTASRAQCPRPPSPPRPATPLQLILKSMNYQQEFKSNAKSSTNTSKRRQRKNDNQQSYQRRSQTYTIIPKQPRVWPRNTRPATAPCMRNKGSQTYFQYDVRPAVDTVDRGTQTIRPARRKSGVRPTSNLPTAAAGFDRCPGKTTLLPTRARANSPPLLHNIVQPEFNNNYKNIEVLYHSPSSSKFNSSVTLIETPRGKRKRKGTGKLPPWR